MPGVSLLAASELLQLVFEAGKGANSPDAECCSLQRAPRL